MKSLKTLVIAAALSLGAVSAGHAQAPAAAPAEAPAATTVANPAPVAAPIETAADATARADEDWTDPLDAEFTELENLLLAISTDDSLDVTEL